MAKVLEPINKSGAGGAVLEVLIDGKPPFGPGGAATRGVTQVVVTSNDTSVLRLTSMKNGQPDPADANPAFAICQPDADGRCLVLAQWAPGMDGEAIYTIGAANAGKPVVNGSGAFTVDGPNDTITADSTLHLVPYEA